MALSPVVSGFMAATDIRTVFGADAIVLLLVSILVGRVMVEHPTQSASPVVEDA